MRALVPRSLRPRDLFDFRRDFDEVFNRFLNWRSSQEEQNFTEGFVPAIETSIDKDGKKFLCQVVLPGVDPKDVNIHVQGNTLSISGERFSSRTGRLPMGLSSGRSNSRKAWTKTSSRPNTGTACWR